MEFDREDVEVNCDEKDWRLLNLEKSGDIKFDFERKENVIKELKLSLYSSIEFDEFLNVKYINGIVIVNEVK